MLFVPLYLWFVFSLNSFPGLFFSLFPVCPVGWWVVDSGCVRHTYVKGSEWGVQNWNTMAMESAMFSLFLFFSFFFAMVKP
jgi:hypothetical protein